MLNILFTGGTGFFGRTLIPELKKKYRIYAPPRKELNLKNTGEVEKYIKINKINIIVHAAIPNLVSSEEDINGNFLADSLLVFMNLYRLQDYYDKMLYFGSGAEYNKDYPIVQIHENQVGKKIPSSEYGFAKYIMNEIACGSEKIYNLRIFGCYGPTDADFKLITYAIHCCLKKNHIKLRQDCVFDYMYVMDLLPVIDYFIEHKPNHHNYNVCTGVQYRISDICKKIIEKMHSSVKVIIQSEGLNNEYTGSNQRLTDEIKYLYFTPLEKGIDIQIKYEIGVLANEKKSS